MKCRIEEKKDEEGLLAIGASMSIGILIIRVMSIVYYLHKHTANQSFSTDIISLGFSGEPSCFLNLKIPNVFLI